MPATKTKAQTVVPMMAQYEALGVRAIIALQKVVGVIESEAQASTGWRSMDPHEREQTLMAYDKVIGEG